VRIVASAARRAGRGGAGLDAVGLDRGGASGPRTVERARLVNGERDDLADDDRVASVRQLERGHVVPFVRVVVGVHEPLPHVGPQHPLAADGVVGVRVRPAGIEPRRAGPRAHEHVVLAVLGFDDLAVPVVELRRNGRALGALDSVAQVARQHARHAPRRRAQRRAGDGAGLMYSRNGFACATWATADTQTAIRRRPHDIRRRPWEAASPPAWRLCGCRRGDDHGSRNGHTNIGRRGARLSGSFRRAMADTMPRRSRSRIRREKPR
jgi:hypothetical protein